jgi:hypothetical protein
MQNSPGGDPETGADIPPMYTPSQLRLLKIAVIGMGVILLVGFTTVIGRIIYLVNSAPPPPAAAAASVASPLVVPAGLALPKGAVIKHLALSGNRLAVHYEGPAGSGIRIVDLVPGGGAVTLPIVEEGGR